VTDSMADPPRGRRPFEQVPPQDAMPSGVHVQLSAARWEAIVADLARRGVTGTPVLIASSAVTWPNGALGCPQPGRSYTQALVEGVRAIVEVDRTTYDYRFGRGDVPRLCGR
jgi:hypothetical protein